MKPFSTTLFAVVILCATVAAAQDQPKFQSAAQIKVASLPGFPECAKAAPVNGDPGKGAAVIFAKFAAGCTVPMHWHSANEQLIAVAGTLKMEHQGGTPETVQKGGFVLMPAKHQHNATCTTAYWPNCVVVPVCVTVAVLSIAECGPWDHLPHR